MTLLLEGLAGGAVEGRAGALDGLGAATEGLAGALEGRALFEGLYAAVSSSLAGWRLGLTAAGALGTSGTIFRGFWLLCASPPFVL